MTKEEFLIELYKRSDLDTYHIFSRDETIEQLDVEENIYDKYSNYWVDKGCLHGPDLTTAGKHLTLYINSEGIDVAENLLEKNKTVSKPNMRIFISHSSEDVQLAESIARLFSSSLDISKKDIRCTSVPGYKLDPGVDTNDAIKREVNESEILFGILTPNSLKSSYVLFELGARWGVEKYLIPAIANGARLDDLPTPIREKNAISLDKKNDLNDLIEVMAEYLNIDKERASSYSKEVDEVIVHALKKKPDIDQNHLKNDSSSKQSISEIISSDAEKISYQEKRRELLKSKKGVNLAIKAGRKFYDVFEQLCKDNSHPSNQIVFRINKKFDRQTKWEVELTSFLGSAFIEFKIPFSNSNLSLQNDKCTYIRVFCANYNLFSGYTRDQKKSDKTYEYYYYFNVDSEGGGAWTKKILGEDFLTSEGLAEKIFTDYYQFQKYYRELSS